LVTDSKGRMGDFIPTIQKRIEYKINSQIREQKSVDFQLFETLKIIQSKFEIDRLYHFFPNLSVKMQVSKEA
jgi:hypothetical protein